jgi:hypothetical protein
MSLPSQREVRKRLQPRRSRLLAAELAAIPDLPAQADPAETRKNPLNTSLPMVKAVCRNQLCLRGAVGRDPDN